MTIEINPVQLTNENINDFRANFGAYASEALARDLVNTFGANDYRTQVESDPNFFSYEKLIDGSAGFYDALPDTYTIELDGQAVPISNLPKNQRAIIFNEPDALSALFSNATQADLADAFVTEFGKSAIATGTGLATVKAISKIPFPPQRFVASKALTQGISFLGGAMAGYEGAERLEDLIRTNEDVILPSERQMFEVARTGGTFAGAAFLPYLLPTKINKGALDFVANMADGSTPNRRQKTTAFLENIIEQSGRSARQFPKITLAGESIATGGAMAGTYGAEGIDPGGSGTRILFDTMGSMTFAATFARMIPKIYPAINNAIQEGGLADQAVETLTNSQTERVFGRINELYDKYDGDPYKLAASLADEEGNQILREVFPNVKFTAAQRLEDETGIIAGIESQFAKESPELDAARLKADRDAAKFFNKFLEALTQEGSADSLRAAGELRKSIFMDQIEARVRAATNRQLGALAQVQKGEFSEETPREFGIIVSRILEKSYRLSRERETQFWQKVPKGGVIFTREMADPERPGGAEIPALIKMYDEMYFDTLPGYRKNFVDAGGGLDAQIADIRRRLGITVDPDALAREQKKIDDAVVSITATPFETSYNKIKQEIVALSPREKAERLKKEAATQFRYGGKGKTSKTYAGLLQAEADVILKREAAVPLAAGGDDPVTGQELFKLKSEILTTIGNLASTTETKRGVAGQIRKLSQIVSAIDEDIDKLPVGTNEAYDTARAFSKALNDVYTRSVLAKARGRTSMGGPKVAPETIDKLFINRNPDVTYSRLLELEDLSSFLRKNGIIEDTLEVDGNVYNVSNLSDAFLRNKAQEFVILTGAKKGQIDPKKLETFVEQNAELLDRFPALQQDLKDATTAQMALDLANERKKLGLKILRRDSMLGTLLGNTTPALAIADALTFTPRGSRQADPVKGLQRLFRLTTRKPQNMPLDQAIDFTQQVKAGQQSAIFEYVLLQAGGDGGIVDPRVMQKLLFEPLPNQTVATKGGSRTLMSLAQDYGIFDASDVKRVKTVLDQMLRVKNAEVAGKNVGEVVDQMGPIGSFFTGILGLAGGTRAYSTVTGGPTGPASISAASLGKRLVNDFTQKIPFSKKLDVLMTTFTDPQLVATLLINPKTAEEEARQARKFLSIMGRNGFAALVTNVAKGVTPGVIRETVEDTEKPTEPDQQSALPQVPVARAQPRQVLPPIAAAPPAPSTQPAPIKPATTASGPVDRNRFAALFPEDKDLIQGIGSLMG